MIFFTSILDATAAKQHSVKCFRCKSAEHMVQNCPFPAAQTTIEKGSKTQKSITRLQDRWYHNGAEGCSNIQTSQCRFQETGRQATRKSVHSQKNVKFQSKPNVEGATPKLLPEVTSPLN